MKRRIDDLRALLTSRFPGAVGDLQISRAEGHGAEWRLIPGKVVEVVAQTAACGEGLLLRSLCEKASHPVALIDGADSFAPTLLSDAARQRLLWVRCHEGATAVRAADLLLRDGNLGTVLLDLRLLPERELLRLPSSVWHRLRLLTERAHAAVGVFSPCRLMPCTAGRWVLGTGLSLGDLEKDSNALATSLRPQSAANTEMLAIAS